MQSPEYSTPKYFKYKQYLGYQPLKYFKYKQNLEIHRKPQPVATGTTAAPTDTDRCLAYPGSGYSKKIMAVGSTIFPPARPAKRDENQAIDPKHII